MPGCPATRRSSHRLVGDVEHACLDPVHELLDLALVLAVDAGGEPVDRVVRERQGFIERVDGLDCRERCEELVAEHPMVGR